MATCELVQFPISDVRVVGHSAQGSCVGRMRGPNQASAWAVQDETCREYRDPDAVLAPTNKEEMCSGSEAGSYLRLIDFVYHSTLGLRVIKKKKK